jgi:hypothetical protein
VLELREQRSMSIFVTTHGRCYDPANGRDRRSLLEDAVDSEYERPVPHLVEKELSSPSALRGLIEPGADVAHHWRPQPNGGADTVAPGVAPWDRVSRVS